MNDLKKKVWLQLIIIYTRYLIGGAFVFASIVKIKGERFTAESGINTPITDAWHMFETLYASGLYWQFLGLGQLIAGGLLMTQKYSKLGALVNLPIIVNIFMITISYDFAFTSVITSLMLLANIFLILWDWNSLKILINKIPNIEIHKRLEHDIVWTIAGTLMLICTIIFKTLILQYHIFSWGLTCFSIGIIGLILGLRRKSKHQ